MEYPRETYVIANECSRKKFTREKLKYSFSIMSQHK